MEHRRLNEVNSMSWYIEVLKKYAVFNGRANRPEYWYFLLFNFLISIVLAIVDGITGIALLYVIYSLAVLIPSLAVGIRRLHDTDRCAWWLFIALIPLIGSIILLIFLATEGGYGDNRYGPAPKSQPSVETA